MIIPVIMAGGAGSRLWPISREAYPKQFIAFQGEQFSLFQQSLQRLQGISSLAPPIVVCNEQHRFLVAEQLRQLGISGATIILEPVGRNTAPAVALAALAAEERGADSTLLVLAADHLIKNINEFQKVVEAGCAFSESGNMVTFGIVPTKAETGYGYIRRGALKSESVKTSAYGVDSFVEKPDFETAQGYLASGEYYWNSGMFMFTAAAFLQELESFAPTILSNCKQAWLASVRDVDFQRIPAEIFAQCPADSIDYAVMEHTTAAVVVALDAGWSDLGAWSALWEEGSRDQCGNISQGDVLLEDVTNSFVQSTSRLVSVVGMDDAVIVETRDAVLVADRNKVQNIKEIVKQLKAAQRSEADIHALVYRPWGSYEGLAEEPGFQVKRIIVAPGASLSLQLHYKRAEHWVVVRGTATVTKGDEVFELQENESTYIPAETRHRLANNGTEPIVLIEVQCGSYLGEDDIVRFDDIYGREGKSD